MKPATHRDTEMKKLAADRRGFALTGKIRSAPIGVHSRLLFACALFLCVSVAIVWSSTRTQQTKAPAATLEGCLKCHDRIEPMHRFGLKGAQDKLENGLDAIGLKCTECHGG